MSDKNSALILWLLVIISALLSIFGAMPYALRFAGELSIVGTIARLLFAIIHGTQRFGLRKLSILFLTTCLVSWCYESLSIATGFPFGHYVYTSELGPKLGTVPMMIMPAYFGVCYLSWILAHVLLDKIDRQIDSSLLFAIPFIASFIMVMWDMSIDPSASTVKHEWIWLDGGSYFGVPFSNFLGWFLCVYTIFQIWAIYLLRTSRKEDFSLYGKKSSWYLAIAFYGTIFLGAIATSMLVNQVQVMDHHGQVWSSEALDQSLGLVSIFTMFFVTCLAFFKVQMNKDLH